MDYKDVTIKDRNWRIVKFDARTGSKIIKKLLPIVLKFLKTTDIKSAKAEDLKVSIDSITKAIIELSDEDFDFIQNACLSVVSESKGVNFIPVLNENGSFGAIGIENDTATVLALTSHALIFNIQGFLDGSPLASLFEGLKGSSQQNLKT